MTSIANIADRFAERIVNPDLRERNARGKNVFAEGDRIYSYGRHFVIARVLRDGNGKPRCILFNGDRYSVSTSRHQADVRAAIRKHARDIPTIIIPFQAIEAARIDIESIVPIDVKPDRFEYIRHESDTMPESAQRTPALHAHFGEESHFTRIYDAFKREHGEHTRYSDGGDDLWKAHYTAAGDLWTIDAAGESQEVREVGGRYVWHTRRHWLGDSLFAARSLGRSKRTRFLSSFDRQERVPLYFLCELPPCSASTIDEALEALKPDAVVLAEAVGRKVTRQGDIFAVPMPGLTARQLREQGATIVKRSDARKAFDAAVDADSLFGAIVACDDVSRSRNWPESSARREAFRLHRRAKWQPILGARFDAAVARRDAAVAGVSMLGTSHVGTEVATMPDGSQYARGIMYHDPTLLGETRERDHARQRMGDGKTWHLIVKNTVPVQ